MLIPYYLKQHVVLDCYSLYAEKKKIAYFIMLKALSHLFGSNLREPNFTEGEEQRIRRNGWTFAAC